MSEGDQRPAGKEKFAASLILLRVALLLGLSKDEFVLVSGGWGGLEADEPSGMSGFSEGSGQTSGAAVASTSGSSATENTHTQRYLYPLCFMRGKQQFRNLIKI